MENFANASAPPSPATAALALYNVAVSALHPTAARWMEIARLLRAEAARHTGGQRDKRLGYARDCEHRARAAARMEARAAIAAAPDFVPVAVAS